MNTLLLSISMACMIVPSMASAQVNHAKVITEDFSTIQGQITTLNQNGLTLINNQGIPTRLDWQSTWGMSIKMHTDPKRLINKIQNENTLVFVDTIDGQRIFMTLLDSENPDFILGSIGPTRVKINLEHVLSVWRQKKHQTHDPLARQRQSTKPITDHITLLNDDDLKGFVLSIGSTVSIETEAGLVTVPLYQTKSIRIANEPDPRGSPGLYVHTFHGLTFHTNRFSMDPKTGKLSITLMPGIIEYEPISEPILRDTLFNWPNFNLKLAAVEIRHPDRWISDPLKSSTIIYSPTGNRPWTPQPSTYNLTINTLDAGSIKLHAPTRLQTDIDPRAVRLHCQFKPAHQPWTNFIATIQAINAHNQQTTIWTQHFTRSDDTAPINVPIPPGTHKLAFIIDPGINGPIQDAGHFAMIRLLINDKP